MSMRTHITAVVRAVLRGSTSDLERAAISVMTRLAVRALIVSKVDYWNSVLAGITGQL